MLKCYDDHGYEKEKCEPHILNYKKCKEFWNTVRLERKRAGVYPNMPPPGERDEIKAEHLKKKQEFYAEMQARRNSANPKK